MRSCRARLNLELLHNFTLTDVCGQHIAAGVSVSLFILIPGYAVAWMLDLFDFRLQDLAVPMALSVPLSIATTPILSYLAGRYVSMSAVWGLYAASWAYVSRRVCQGME